MREKIFVEKVMPLFGISIIFMGISTLLSEYIKWMFTPIGMSLIFILEIITIFISYKLKRKNPLNILLLFIFSFLTGLTLTPIIYYSTSIDPFSIFISFILSSSIFFAMSIYSSITKKDFRSFGGFLSGALSFLIFLSIVEFFIHNLKFSMIIDVFISILFTFMILFDVSRILRDYDDKDYPAAVLSIYIDFINIFVRLMSFLLRVKKKNDNSRR